MGLSMSRITELAEKQLEAYNASDLDTFVACYHQDVRVLKGDEESLTGRKSFRARYQTMFESWAFGASVPQRLSHGDHCVDLEEFWRVDPSTGERHEGTILVRYQLRDDLIGTVQFLG